MGARPDLLLQRELQLQVVGIGCIWVSLLGERNEVGGNTVWSEGEKEEGRGLGTSRIESMITFTVVVVAFALSRMASYRSCRSLAWAGGQRHRQRELPD